MAENAKGVAQTEGGREPTSFIGRFTVLRRAMRELWIVFAFKFLGVVAYVVMNTTLILWLSSDLGYSDEKAGTIVGIWSALMTFFTVLVGSLTDAIGLRKAFLLGLVVCVFARGVMTFTTLPWLALVGGMVPLALGEALGIPVVVAALRRYTTTAQRSIAFAISYAVMNVGFLVANYLFDYLRAPLIKNATFPASWHLGEHGQFTLPLIGARFSTYRTLFLISFLFELSLLPILYFGLREGVEATDEGVKTAPEQPRRRHEKALNALWLMCSESLNESVRVFVGLWRNPGFYRFLAFLSMAAFVRLIFVHMSYTYPKFGVRELGEGAPIGSLSAVNSILIIFLAPLVGVLSQKIAAYRMLTVGSMVAAASVFIMAMPPAWFQGMADGMLGHLVGHWYLDLKGSVNPWYVMIFLYVVLLSVGESMYSPRLYEYAAAIAPKGQEASYMSLSYLPFYLAKLMVAPLSGVLLARYCPETGPRSSGTMWLIIALTTMICPLGLIVLRRYIRVQEAGREG
jgi:MFS family permease